LIDAYIKRGLLERVAIVNTSGHTPCIRLTAAGEESMYTPSTQPKPTTKEVVDQELEEELSVLPLTRSIGQTVYDLLENAGQEGIIYKVNYLSSTNLWYDNPDMFEAINRLCATNSMTLKLEQQSKF
jgi:hypothetical protein